MIGENFLVFHFGVFDIEENLFQLCDCVCVYSFVDFFFVHPRKKIILMERQGRLSETIKFVKSYLYGGSSIA